MKEEKRAVCVSLCYLGFEREIVIDHVIEERNVNTTSRNICHNKNASLREKKESV
jgi:hypothetical protein